jgi:hypothetical protein
MQPKLNYYQLKVDLYKIFWERLMFNYKPKFMVNTLHTKKNQSMSENHQIIQKIEKRW